MAIYHNYRALVDPTASGGYGTLYGPNLDVNGGNTLGEGKIAGQEWLAYDDDGSGRQNVTMMVQVPANFDRSNPCIVTGTSSGSRGVYGAIATAGEWGLKHGCAVAYTDKGTGTGVHDLQNDSVNLIDGTRQDAKAPRAGSNFTAPLSDAERTAYLAAHPDRFAIKHAHSQQNPEKDWGRFTLHAVEFAYYVLNQMFGVPQGNGRWSAPITPARSSPSRPASPTAAARRSRQRRRTRSTSSAAWWRANHRSRSPPPPPSSAAARPCLRARSRSSTTPRWPRSTRGAPPARPACPRT